MSKKSIAQEVLGITSQNPVLAFAQAHKTLTGEDLDNAPLGDSLGEVFNNEPIDLIEYRRAIEGITDLILYRHEEVLETNTLIDWPSYSLMIDQYGEKSDGSARALMIGSFSSLSSRAFNCLAHSVYGADNVYVVDPVGGEHKARHGSFVYGSGLELPFRSESMDFVHTNRLTHMLEDPSSPSRPDEESMLSLFSEISRVLASGGQLLMKESTPNSRRYATQIELAEGTANFGFFVTSALRRFGLEHVRAEPGKMWPGKDYLFDENRDFDRYPASISVGSAEFYARKQPQ